MKFKEIYSDNEFTVSFEVFPPKDDSDGMKTSKLLNTLEVLKKHNPAFVSLTYGAGGSTKTKSYELINLFKDMGLSVMPHFTCINTKKDEVCKYIRNLKDLEIENILALRGDIPPGESINNFEFKHAIDLIRYIKAIERDNFSIAAAGYCEGHIEATSKEDDFNFMLKKIDAGAEAIFTQLFFDNSYFLQFRDKLKKNYDIPLIAGIMPIISIKQVEKMTGMNNISIPKNLLELLEKYKEKPDDIRKLGIEYATEQCSELLKNDVKFFHFYTLNLSQATDSILKNLKAQLIN